MTLFGTLRRGGIEWLTSASIECGKESSPTPAKGFRQKRGKVFTYTIGQGGARPSTTDQLLARSQFEKALARMPTEGPGALQDLRGPSYLWAILMDDRVRREDW